MYLVGDGRVGVTDEGRVCVSSGGWQSLGERCDVLDKKEQLSNMGLNMSQKYDV